MSNCWQFGYMISGTGNSEAICRSSRYFTVSFITNSYFQKKMPIPLPKPNKLAKSDAITDSNTPHNRAATDCNISNNGTVSFSNPKDIPPPSKAAGRGPVNLPAAAPKSDTNDCVYEPILVKPSQMKDKNSINPPSEMIKIPPPPKPSPASKPLPPVKPSSPPTKPSQINKPATPAKPATANKPVTVNKPPSKPVTKSKPPSPPSKPATASPMPTATPGRSGKGHVPTKALKPPPVKCVKPSANQEDEYEVVNVETAT